MKNITYLTYAFLSLLILSCSTDWESPEQLKKSYPLHSDWEFKQANKEQWYPATVPGVVHTDLFQNKLIEDPFYRQNEKDLQWIEEEDWVYKTTFDLPTSFKENQHFALNFEGLDTYADVTLNGKKVISSDNMFVGYNKEVTSLLKEKGNVLEVYFHSPIKITKPLREQAGFEYPADNDAREEKYSIYSRKAPYSFGWDWGPRFVTSGIWRPVELVVWNSAQINDVHLQQVSLTEEKAKLKATVEVKSSVVGDANIRLTNSSSTFSSEEKKVMLNKGLNVIELEAEVENPELWWPNGLGEQTRYEIITQLNVDGDFVDQESHKIGFRTVEVINEPDSIGESFFVKVNGQPVFMKGANYIPQDSFLPSVTKDRYDWMIESMVRAHMNMVRMWGGGIYESDYFYDQCDEKGLLVWQDFMFACTMYPGDKDFIRKVKEEAAYNIKRLRNRPSLALWCGNNEVGVAWDNWGWQDSYGWSEEVQTKLKEDYNRLFKEVLPDMVKTYDEGRFYYPSSPISNWGNLEDFTIGDNHFWGVWHGKYPFESFKEYVPRFMSEYGFQSFPSFKAIKKFTIEEDWGLETDVMNTHQKSYTGNGLIKVYMERDFNVPTDFEDFVYVGQLLQADGMRQGFEIHRRRMPYCMGTLYWQLDDCWPAASWSSIDYYGEWKALHYAAERAFQQQLISTDIEDELLAVWLVNDEWKDFGATLNVKWNTFEGKEIAKKSLPIKVDGNTSKVVLEITLEELLGRKSTLQERKSMYLTLEAVDAKGKVITKNYAFFVKPKDQILPKANITTTVIENGNELKIKLQSNAFAESVALSLEGEATAHFSDNYFHLEANQEKVITVERTTITAEELKQALEVKCLNNL
ncbi:glycoside hydrolase family 2 protein [Flammeovirga sp. EKP202]|uniref:beta-mannosidase n=1 Tax=Flammeovirga sp. EKP202 TaxID=2770592 RepID=UPI00165FE8E1|nr:glycoside hydrolase family 2 protein [Flammeovirga sp. EKP202]MBD0402705.1 glycoside hydrolase family 2 protein [Flammeovirga sp. EKP202]